MTRHLKLITETKLKGKIMALGGNLSLSLRTDNSFRGCLLFSYVRWWISANVFIIIILFFYNGVIVFGELFKWVHFLSSKIDGCLWSRGKTARRRFTRGDHVFSARALMCGLRQTWPKGWVHHSPSWHVCPCICMGRLIAHHTSCHGVNVTSVARNDERNHVVGSSSEVFISI